MVKSTWAGNKFRTTFNMALAEDVGRKLPEMPIIFNLFSAIYVY
jgi:hypothetical protein